MGWQSLEMDAVAPGTAEAHEIVGQRCWCATAGCCYATAPLVGDGTQMYGTFPGGHVEDGESPIKALAQ